LLRLSGPSSSTLVAGAVSARWVPTVKVLSFHGAVSFLARFERVERLDAASFALEALPNGDGPLVVVPAVP
jgi:hypothetical protein